MITGPRVVCSNCQHAEELKREDGIMPHMPPGWASVTIAERGSSTLNLLLCRRCLTTVKNAAIYRSDPDA
jgi:hypothetical protein